MIRFIFIFFPLLLFGQFDHVLTGIGLDIGSSGSGIFVTRQYMHASDKFSLNGEWRFYDMKADEEMVVYNFWGEPVNIGGISLVMMPIFFGGNYYPFAGEIANNFSPFITFRGGPIYTLDGDETGSFSERWSNPKSQWSFGGFIGVGIDFKWVSQSMVTLMVGGEILPLREAADTKKDYSGLLIHIAFSRQKR